MTKLHQLHDRSGQSPWLDNLTRGDLVAGRLRRLVDEGIRGVTSNPTIIAKAIGGSADYDRQLAALAGQGLDAQASYWALGLGTTWSWADRGAAGATGTSRNRRGPHHPRTP